MSPITAPLSIMLFMVWVHSVWVLRSAVKRVTGWQLLQAAWTVSRILPGGSPCAWAVPAMAVPATAKQMARTALTKEFPWPKKRGTVLSDKNTGVEG